jgi:uncharacterized protein (TIGR00297 family)
MITHLTLLLIQIGIVIVVGLIAYRMNALNSTGFLTAVSIGSLIMVFGGIKWFIILVTLLILTVVATRFKYYSKMEIEAAEGKGGVRGWKNVLSNGTIATLIAIFFRITMHKIYAGSYLGAISTSIADTLATELGLLSPSSPRLITNLNIRVRAGASGGITILGEASGLLGSVIIAALAMLIGFEGLNAFQIIISTLCSGFLGNNFDSLLGATVQAIYKCQECDKMTEERTHCERSTIHVKGCRYIDNNVVNFASTIFGAFVASTFLQLTI